ncbi:hypothetical protein FACS1894187_25190 [Synergistales bacterium]|nr:hypothetical protein FACS1894187_25190 [Synergistales bacterium]
MEKNKPCVALLRSNVEDLPKLKKDTGKKLKQLKKFRRSIESNVNTRSTYWMDMADITENVANAMDDLKKDSPVAGWVRGSQPRENSKKSSSSSTPNLDPNDEDDYAFLNQPIEIKYTLYTPTYFRRAHERDYRTVLNSDGVFLLCAKQCSPDCTEYKLLNALRDKLLAPECESDFAKEVRESGDNNISLHITGQDVLEEARKIFFRKDLFIFSTLEKGERGWTLTKKGMNKLDKLENQKDEIKFVILISREFTYHAGNRLNDKALLFCGFAW